jgi:hypothetical protein
MDNAGPYRLDCWEACVVDRDGTSGPPVRQPPLPGALHAVAVSGGVLWTASVGGGLPYTAASADDTRTWRRAPVPPGEVPLARVDLQVSPDGRDLWLVGQADPEADGGFGTLARRKEVGVPLLWVFRSGHWIRTGLLGRPESRPAPFPAAAVGNGLVAVASFEGLYLVDHLWRRVDLFPRPEWVSALADGTIVASASSNGTVFLGRLVGTRVIWVKVGLAAKT